MATNEGEPINKIQKKSGDNELNRETTNMIDFTTETDEIKEISEELLSKYHAAFIHNDESSMKSMIKEEPALLFYGLDLMAMSVEDDQEGIIEPELQKGLDEISQRIQQKFENDRDENIQMKLIKQGFVSYFTASGKKASELSEELNLGKMTLNKLNDRLVEATTIPVTLISRIAEVLGASQSAIQAYFQQPPLQTEAMYKSSDHPITVRSLESFSDIIHNDPTTRPEDKDFWLNAS